MSPLGLYSMAAVRSSVMPTNCAKISKRIFKLIDFLFYSILF